MIEYSTGLIIFFTLEWAKLIPTEQSPISSRAEQHILSTSKDQKVKKTNISLKLPY